MHDGFENTVQAVKILLPELKKMGDDIAVGVGLALTEYEVNNMVRTAKRFKRERRHVRQTSDFGRVGIWRRELRTY